MFGRAIEALRTDRRFLLALGDARAAAHQACRSNPIAARASFADAAVVALSIMLVALAGGAQAQSIRGAESGRAIAHIVTAPESEPHDMGASAASPPAASPPAALALRHAIAMHGEPDLPPDFQHLPYADPSAPKGGQLVFGVHGSFDNLNPFIVRGVKVDNIRGYVFESLMARSGAEPFSLYGLLAHSIAMPDDRSMISFYLRPEARFSDGMPLTSADVAFSLDLLRRFGPPFMRSHYSKVTAIETPEPHVVRFRFATGDDREIPLILALMPILPRHRIDPDRFEQTTLEPMIGSGPYMIGAVDPGRSVTFTRNPDYWGRDLPIRRGQFNFDTIRLEYFREQTAMFEAFKSGALDLRFETESVRWAEGYRFPAVTRGDIVTETIPTSLPDGMNALVFNTRKPVFADQRVRRALIELFDFEWINASLFNGLYARTESYFARSELASTGRPASPGERELLSAFPDAVAADVLEGTWRLPTGDGTGRNRARLRAALDLLEQAGYVIDGRRIVSRSTGAHLSFEFLSRSKGQERLLLAYRTTLERIGISVAIRQVDDAQYWSRLKSFDFDMVQWRWPASLSPGNEQIHRWSSEYANVEGSLNLAGVENPAADAMISAMLGARDESQFVDAVRAFDRVLLSGDYVVPLHHAPGTWVARKATFERPLIAPLSGFDLDTWWHQPRAEPTGAGARP
ncbi:MAG: extracellular solute-binding protein [Hyphomicrobiaceae bacterium]